MSSSESLYEYLYNVTDEINRYFSIVILLFGTIGNLLNIVVLSHRTFRLNPCAWLFLISSTANLLTLLSGLTTRTLAGWAVDPTNTLDWLCKLRGFMIYYGRTVAYWLIVLATIDRWFLSHANINQRQKSCLKNVQKGTLIVSILSIFLYLHLFYCYRANLIGTPLPCYSFNKTCRYLIDVVAFLMSIILPIALIIIFGLMTIYNIRRSRNRVNVFNNSHIQESTRLSTLSFINRRRITRQTRKTDRYLFKMLIIQSILLTLFTLPLVVERIYSMFIRPQKTPLESAIDQIIYNLSILLNYLTNGMPFYIYTLFGGHTFRRKLFDMIKSICHGINS